MGLTKYPREEELKIHIGQEYFPDFECSHKLGNVDFAVCVKKQKDELDFPYDYLLWAEAKRTPQKFHEESLIQLILTIGKEKTYDKCLPPHFLAAIDPDFITFIRYRDISFIFRQIDFDWNVTPSDHSTKEFKQLWDIVHKAMYMEGGLLPLYEFNFHTQDKDLRDFIRSNFKVGVGDTALIEVDEERISFVHDEWCRIVKPTINVHWDVYQKRGVYTGDFFLADLLSVNNDTEKVNKDLAILLKGDQYVVARDFEDELIVEKKVSFNDEQKAHKRFWSIYQRPPEVHLWDYFALRRDLLIPPDVRERKGSFFTPEIWVSKSQEYLRQTLGVNWKQEYYIWDCCTGTGNLLYGLNMPYRTWASDIDEGNVKDTKAIYCKDGKIGDLLSDNVFQFDFLNDKFIPQSQGGKIPDKLYQIIKEEPEKLVVYINPPYAEAETSRTVVGTGEHRNQMTTDNDVYRHYGNKIGNASNELFALFFTRVFYELQGCILAEFSTLKHIFGSNFSVFRTVFTAKLLNVFLVPADTFDNVKGDFPIGFFIWNTGFGEYKSECTAKVFNRSNQWIGTKHWDTFIERKNINQWIKEYDMATKNVIGHIENPSPDVQQNRFLYISIPEGTGHVNHFAINKGNLIYACIYLSIRKCIAPTWLNDRDQFWHPNDGWKDDTEFQNDCLIYTLFHNQNRISSADGKNNWIPFTEDEVHPKGYFESHFMSEFIEHLTFSQEAMTVKEAGRKLWTYYHEPTHYNTNVNASLYDIRRYFQGVDEKTGRMNNNSTDTKYNELRQYLTDAINHLGDKIAIKVYKYGFLTPQTGTEQLINNL